MRKHLILMLAVAALALAIAACQQLEPGFANNTSIAGNLTIEPGAAVIDEGATESGKGVQGKEGLDKTGMLSGVVIEATEGDLVQLKPQAVDPDDDTITFYFTSPFDAGGKWQTKEGDAGQYQVKVTASDGKANTSQEITVVIKKAKKAPVIECPESVTAKEGDLIQLNCNIYDPEGDQAVVEYSGFMKGPSYQATFEDAGEYTTVIMAKNQYKDSSKTIKITILNTNRAPVLELSFGSKLTGVETDILTLSPKLSDPDGDEVSVKFSEPFDSTGTWKTKIGDAGVYTATLVASDGSLTTKKEFTVELKMKNTAPVLKVINDITVSEGEAIKLPISATDREGDRVKITVKGWMNSESYTTTYEDSGEYSVTVVASDGQLETSQTFKVTVLDKNRPPVFKIPA
jgi:plastocyanin